jgi:hypothetical protein
MVWCAVMWYGVVRSGVVWCGVMRCGHNLGYNATAAPPNSESRGVF